MTQARMIGHYEITQLLGEGGLGQVHAARDTVLGREVAIKSLRPAMLSDQSFIERFRAEAMNLARLNHQNITTIYSLVEENGVPHMVMELVRGRTLDHVLQSKGGRLAVDEAMAIVGQAADGLAYAHAQGIVHRDIKPANLMITDAGLLKIMDFGIARLEGSQRLTRDGSIVGTLAYMAPEQLRSEETDARTDLYSLAIVLYEMLCGSVPFSAASDYELMRAQISDLPEPLGKRVPGLDAHIERAVMQALAKKPGDRFPSAAAFKDTLGGVALRADSPTVMAKVTRLVSSLPAAMPVLAVATRAAAATERSSLYVALRGVAIGSTLALAATGAFLLFKSAPSPPPAGNTGVAGPQPAPTLPATPATVQLPQGAPAARGGGSPAIVPLANPYQFAPPGSRSSLPTEDTRGAAAPDGNIRAADTTIPTRAVAAVERSVALSPREAAPETDMRALKTRCDAAAASPLDKERPRSVIPVPADKIDPAVAVPACEAAARAAPDDGRMHFQLGRSYGAAKDYARAMAAYKRADELGNVLATNNIGALYAEGLGVKEDPAEARTWYKRAASEGLAFAMKNLGELYQSGTGVQKDYEQARQWYERAASAGEVDAMLRLGIIHEDGLGISADPVEARRWYEQAAAAGNTRAMVRLAGLYQEGTGVPKDAATAWRWYDKAAQAGNADAMYMLGVFNYNGIAVSKGYPEARRWYEKAAALGHPGAMNNLGFLYAEGAGVPKDYSEARRWYEKAAAAGNPMAMNNIAFLYQHGYGVPRDNAEARRWYEKAVAAGETRYAPEALKRLGRGR